MQIVTSSKGYRGKGMFGAPDPLSELSFFAAVDSTSFLSSQTFMHILNASWTCDICGPAAAVSNLEDILSSMAPPLFTFFIGNTGSALSVRCFEIYTYTSGHLA